MGSCFTEHLGNRLEEMKFKVLQNPNGILFDPLSVSSSLQSYVYNKPFSHEDLFFENELWQSWQHHSSFSNISREECLANINTSRQRAHDFMKEASWILITLGSSFSYRLLDSGMAVANCHRVPAQRFRKYLMTIEEINVALDNCIHQLLHFNPGLRIIFTISPVRHIRDGVIDNNRSKARLLEVVHHLVQKFEGMYYFPAYELVVDVLRDYRFYDIDMVHPNYTATEFVLEKFKESCLDPETAGIMDEIRKITIARKHKPFHPQTKAHKKFLFAMYEKTRSLSDRYPFLNLEEELAYFGQ
jgi:hypothetical protein